MLKYLNKGSNHQKAYFKAIATNIMKVVLKRLTSVTAARANKNLGKLYSEHVAALEQAGLSHILL